MAYSTPAFVYTPRQIVVVLSGNSARIYMPQYAKRLTLNRGVDNQLQFQFLNQEQKPVDITGLVITFRLISYDGNTVLLTKALDLDLPLTGIASLNTSAADLFPISPQQAYYSLSIPVNNGNYPVFVNQNASARGDINVVDSVLPSFVTSSVVTIPTGQAFPNLSSEDQYVDSTYEYFSSPIGLNGGSILTIQASYYEYNGNVTIEGSCQPDSDWYPIMNNTYDAITDTIGYTVQGFHPFVRMAFESNSGAVTHILSR